MSENFNSFLIDGDQLLTELYLISHRYQNSSYPAGGALEQYVMQELSNLKEEIINDLRVVIEKSKLDSDRYKVIDLQKPGDNVDK